MKKLLISSVVLLSLLAACAEETPKEVSKDEEKQAVSAEASQDVETNEEKEKDENEVKDGPLTIPGQWTTEEDGTKVTLVKIKEANQTQEIGPFKVTIESVKLFHYTDLPSEDLEYYKAQHDKDVSNGLNIIQIKYTAENTTDANLLFDTVDTVTTDTKAQISGDYNTAITDDDHTFKGQVAVQGVDILPYFNGSLEDINVVNIITSDVFDLDSDMPSSLSESQKIEIKF